MNFKSIGKNVTISPKASIYRPEMIEIGDNVRIDDFCIISAGDGGIKIGNFVHIACYVSMIGAGRIELEDFAQVGSKSIIMSSSDDFSGGYLVGPCVPEEYRNVNNSPVTLKMGAVLGAMVIVLPGVTIGYNTAVGAMSLVRHDLEENKLYCGNPLRLLKDRPDNLPKSDYFDQMEWYKEGFVTKDSFNPLCKK